MARRILEIGTGDGERTLALAGQLDVDGLLITMEADPSLAAFARERFKASAHADRISVIVGETARFLHKLRGPFDLIVDNDPGNEALHGRLMDLLGPGGVLIRGDRKYSG